MTFLLYQFFCIVIGLANYFGVVKNNKVDPGSVYCNLSEQKTQRISCRML